MKVRWCPSFYIHVLTGYSLIIQAKYFIEMSVNDWERKKTKKYPKLWQEINKLENILSSGKTACCHPFSGLIKFSTSKSIWGQVQDELALNMETETNGK